MSGAAVRHGIAALALAVAALGGLLAVDRIGRHSFAPGAIWVLARGDPGRLLAGLPSGDGLRILQSWRGGRIVLLHAPVLAAASLPREAAWFVLRAAPAAFSLPACG